MVKSNDSAFDGGGIYVESTGTLTLTSTTLHSNTVSGAAGGDAFGGGIYNDGTDLTITSSTFTSNVTSNTTVNDGHGGGLYTSGGTVTITSSTFSLNQAARESESADGGAVYQGGGTVTITDSTLSTNSSGDDGGGLYVGSATTTITNSTFTLNTDSTTRSAAAGGGLYGTAGIVTITSSTFSYNYAGSSGGGTRVDSSSTITITSSTFKGNSAQANGGGVYVDTGTATITGGLYTLNMATSSSRSGGAIYNDTSAMTITSATIRGNEAGASGGGILSSGTTLTLSDSIISFNTSTDGGGIYSGGTTFIMSDSSITSNLASSTNAQGGGLYLNSGTVTITSSTINTNLADDNGGGIYMGTASTTISDTTITSNTASSTRTNAFGGGIDNFNGLLLMTSSTISSNTAGGDGGGIYNSATTTLANVTISSNTANDDGGGVFNNADTTSFSHVTVVLNSAASDAAGLWVQSDNVTLVNTLFATNTLSNGNLENCQVNGGSLTSSGNNLEASTSTLYSCNLTETSDVTTTVAIATILNTTLALNGGKTMNHALVTSSPAIDVGGFPSFGSDQRGTLRPQGAMPDIGSYEFVPLDQGVTVSQSAISVSEGSGASTYTLVLDVVPRADVDVTVAGSSGDISISPSSLTFSTSTWNVPQTVSVTAVDDSTVESTESATVTHTASTTDSAYATAGISSVTVTITDNDTNSSGGGSVIVHKIPSFSSDTPIQINGGALTVDDTAVILSFDVATSPDVIQMAVENGQGISSSDFVPYTKTMAWELSPGNGKKQVCARFRTAQGAVRDACTSIELVGQEFNAPSEITCAVSSGNAYKHPDALRKDVWYVFPGVNGEQCTKRAFSGAYIFFTYFSDWSQVVLDKEIDVVKEDTLMFMPYGPLLPRQYGALVKTTDNADVYLLVGDQSYTFDSLSTLRTLGYNTSYIIDVDGRVLDQYTYLGDIDYIDHHPTYALIKYQGASTVYYVDEKDNVQVRREVDSLETLRALGLRTDLDIIRNVALFSPTDAYVIYPDGDAFTLNDI